MKKYGIAFLFYALLLCAAYYGSFRLSYRYAGEQTKEQMENAGEAVLADTTEKAILKADTEYVVENYNRRTGVTREVRERIPTALLGLDREEALAYAKDYTKEPGIEELENGFEQMDLVSFSDAKVVFRKTYFPWEKRTSMPWARRTVWWWSTTWIRRRCTSTRTSRWYRCRSA